MSKKRFLPLLAIVFLLALEVQAQSSRQCTTFNNAGTVPPSIACLDSTSSPNPGTVGQPITLTITESSAARGGTASQNTAAIVQDSSPLIDILPPGLSFVSVTNNGGDNLATGLAQAPACTFTPPDNSSNSSGTVTCPGARAFTGPVVHAGSVQPVPYTAAITVIPTSAGPFSNSVLDGFNATSAAFTVLSPELEVNYFAGADGSRPDETVRITNPGSGIDPTINPPGDLCANIYVVRSGQQLAECCSCLVTPGGLRTLSVDFDLTHNPLTNPLVGEGSIEIVSSIPSAGSCPIDKAGWSYIPSAPLRAWGVHNQDVSSPGNLSGNGVINQVTETEFSAAPLSGGELSNLQRNCAFIFTQGSGAGRCTCGRGD